jgi:hypothetical protein
MLLLLYEEAGLLCLPYLEVSHYRNPLTFKRCQSGQSTDQQSAGNTLRKRTWAFGQQHLRKKMALSRLTRCLPHDTSMSIYNERHPEKQILACSPHS